MSISMRSGMSLGRHSTSTSRVMKSTNPPSVLTPDGFALGNDGHGDPDDLVHGDLDEVGVDELVRRRVDLELLDHGVPELAVEPHLEDRVLARLRSS